MSDTMSLTTISMAKLACASLALSALPYFDLFARTQLKVTLGHCGSHVTFVVEAVEFQSKPRQVRTAGIYSV